MGHADDNESSLIALREQVEFYLSDGNLMYDEFFQEKIKSNSGGWLEIDYLLSCKQMKAIGATQESVIAALRDSHLEVQNENGASAAVRRPQNLPLPELQKEKRLDPSDWKEYTLDEIEKKYRTMFSHEDVKRYWEEDMKKQGEYPAKDASSRSNGPSNGHERDMPFQGWVIGRNHSYRDRRPPRQDEGELPGTLVGLSRILSRILRHQASELHLTVSTDGFIPLGEVMQLNDRFPGQFKPLQRSNMQDIEMVVRTSLSDGFPRFELKSADGANFIRARHNTTLPAVHSCQLPAPPPGRKPREHHALRNGPSASGFGCRRAAEPSGLRAKDQRSRGYAAQNAAQEDISSISRRKTVTFDEQESISMLSDLESELDLWHKQVHDPRRKRRSPKSKTKKDRIAPAPPSGLPAQMMVAKGNGIPSTLTEECYIGTQRDDVDGQKQDSPRFSRRLRPWNELSMPNHSIESHAQPQCEVNQQYSSVTPSQKEISNVQVVRQKGEKCTVQRSCTKLGEGYLCLSVGDTVELLYIGKEVNGDAGWYYAVHVETSEQGWLPQSSLEASLEVVDLQKDAIPDLGVSVSPSLGNVEAAKGTAQLQAGCEAKAIRFVDGNVSAGYLTIHEDERVKVQYIGRHPDEAGWVYGCIDGQAGWLPSDALLAVVQLK